MVQHEVVRTTLSPTGFGARQLVAKFRQKWILIGVSFFLGACLGASDGRIVQPKTANYS